MNIGMVSVVITAYNKEKYIYKCITSVINQTYKNLDVVIIDDGSVDGTQKICNYLASKDYRLNFFVKTNGGVSSARNEGIRHIMGEYVIFLDGDDYLDNRYIEKMMNYSQYDLVQTGYTSDRSGVIDAENIRTVALCGLNNISDYIFKNSVFKFFSVPWAKLYKSSIVIKNDIHFRNQSFGEDTIFVFEYLKYVYSVKIISDCGYNNVIVPQSLSRTRVNNIWIQLDNVLKYGDNTFKLQYNKYWAFLFVRMIKLTLINYSNNYCEFRRVCKKIGKTNNFKNLNVFKIENKISKLVYIFLKLKLYFILFKLINIKIKLDK